MKLRAGSTRIRKDRPLSDRIAQRSAPRRSPTGAATRVLRQRLSLEPVGATLLCGTAHADWHSTCKVKCAVSLGKKRAKRFFVIYFAGPAQSGTRGAPSTGP